MAGASRRHARAVVLLALLAGTASASPALSQPEQTPSAAPGSITLRVDALTTVLDPGETMRGELRVRNRTDLPQEGVRVLVGVHRRTDSRFAYQRAVDHGEVGQLWTSFDVEIGDLPARGSVPAVLERTASQLRFNRPAEKAGVYPVVIQLLAGDEVVDEVVTSVVLAPESVEDPVRLALLAAFTEAPALAPELPGVGPDPAAPPLRALPTGPTGRLHRLVEELADAPAIPLTIATDGHLLERTAEGTRADRAFGQALRRLVDRVEVEQLSLPYAGADLVALVRGDLADQATRSLADGASSVEAMSQVRPSPGVLWPPDGLDRATLDAVTAAGTRAVVLEEEQLLLAGPPADGLSGVPLRALRNGTGAPVQALVPDPYLQAALRSRLGHDGAVVAAQRIIGETAAVHFEQPFAPVTRGLLVAAPQDWDPPPGFFAELAARVRAAPWLQAVTLDGLRTQIDPDRGPAVGVEYLDAVQRRELPPLYVATLVQARASLRPFGTLLVDPGELPAHYDHLLRVAASTGYRPAWRRAEGQALVAVVTEGVGSVASGVTVRDGPPVTLTDTDGIIPVTISSSSPLPLQLQVRLDAPRFDFAAGGVQQVTLQPGQTVTLGFGLRPKTPGGTAPIRVLVTDPAGDVVLAAGNLVVRSTTASVGTLVVTAGAGLFLVVWWGRDMRRRHRAARSVREDQPVVAVPVGGDRTTA